MAGNYRNGEHLTPGFAMDIVAKFMLYLVWLSAGAYLLGRVQTRKGLVLAALALACTLFVLPKFTLTWGGDAAQAVVQKEGHSTKD